LNDDIIVSDAQSESELQADGAMHTSPCERLHQVESRVLHLSVRLDNMKETVARNQEEFKARITGLEGMLAFLIMAGIALVGALQL
jgi:hypothetical protein